MRERKTRDVRRRCDGRDCRRSQLRKEACLKQDLRKASRRKKLQNSLGNRISIDPVENDIIKLVFCMLLVPIVTARATG